MSTEEQGGVNRAKVVICGEELVLKGRESTEYLQHIAQVVGSHMERLRDLHPNLVRHRLALLTAIHLADEVEKLKAENRELLQALEEAR
ncbi:MAG: cell division protein ZapA [Firmicutes bacterium]|jgi:cell division protein ZapA|nr:cell division protein ZapA [Bacillota bacterium]